MIPKLEVSGVSYSYHSLDGETLALSDISFTVNTGEFLAIVGPSGCGKSTLLTMLCGLTTPDSGAILLDGNPLTRDASAIGYMLQKDHLFEWRTIFSNVSLGLEIQKRLDEPAKHELQAMINTYGLGGFENAYPSELSGGMRQRAALIRTLALKPELLLLDEPFNGLDQSGVEEMRALFLEKAASGVTILLASHHGEDIDHLCHTVHRMESGVMTPLMPAQSHSANFSR